MEGSRRGNAAVKYLGFSCEVTFLRVDLFLFLLVTRQAGLSLGKETISVLI